MKALLLIVTLFLCIPYKAQERNIIIDSSYAFTVVPPQSIPSLPPGDHLFKTTFDYIRFLNSDFLNPVLVPLFFSDKEMGLILQEELNSSSYGFTVESVYETNTEVLVNTKITKSMYYKCNMSTKLIFIVLKRTNKDIIITERTEMLSQ